MIETLDYHGPERRDPSADTAVTMTSVRLRFDADGRSVWEAATDEPQRRTDDETVRLLAALNEEAADDDSEDPDDTIGHRTLMAFEAGEE